MKITSLCLLSLGSLVSLPVHALSASKKVSQFAIDSWHTSDGLPEMAIQAITQTTDGYLWIGTQEGLARFDGKRFVTFNHANTPALQSDLIFSLVEDSAGFLWIGTVTGIVMHSNAGGFHAVDVAEHMNVSRVRCMVRDRDGSVWIGGVGGLAHVSAGAVVGSYALGDGNDGEENSVSRLAVDGQGVLWAVSHGRLYRWGNDAFNRIDEGIAGRVSSLFVNSQGELLLLSDDRSLYRRNENKFEKWWPNGVPTSAQISDIHEDRQRNIWIATFANGLFRSSESGIFGQFAEHSFSEYGLLKLFEDSSESLWIGTLGHGLIRVRDGAFTTYTKEEGLLSNNIYSVEEDLHGSIWTGTLDGASSADLDGVQQFTRQNGLPSNFISSLARANNGGMWLGTLGPSVAQVLNGKVTQVLNLKTPRDTTRATALLEDRESRLWIGTDGAGVARRGADVTRYFSTARGFQSNFVNAIAEDAGGAIWIGTNAGIMKIEGERPNVNPIASERMPRLAISTLHFDAHGTLWIGTFGTGLFAWQDGILTAFSGSRSLPEETINSVLSDANDDIWIGTNRGITRYRRVQLEQFMDDSHTTLMFDRFNEADGMKDAETSGGAQPSAIRATDGRLWFATSSGVVVVDPSLLGAERTVGRPVIESITTNDNFFGRDLREIKLPFPPAWVQFDFTTPDLSSGSTSEFRYRLSGIDESWFEAAKERNARYALPGPGRHVFEVQSRRQGGDWSAPAASVVLQIQPLFYQTRWFFILVLLSVVAMLVLFHLLRMRWILMRSAVSEERRRIAGEIHDHLAQGFSGIAIQIDAAIRRLSRAPEMARPHLILARDVAVSSLTDARRSVWNLKESGDLGTFADKLRQLCGQIVFGTEVKILVGEIGRPWVPKALVELQLTRIVEEAVSNAIEHGKADAIEIVISYSLTTLALVVVDNGNGFDARRIDTSATRGFGLTNMKHRVRQIRGTLEIDSSPGVGTKAKITVPRVFFLMGRKRDKNNEKRNEASS